MLFNRQPSLHRISIMAHRVRVRDGRCAALRVCHWCSFVLRKYQTMNAAAKPRLSEAVTVQFW